ncbi:MAG: Polysaccharide biosynthesis/export protein [Ferruginibacter sp.]|uniref:polysaccharide biosynthesis/export family protein n=1 Tax=Ferruginibacter sp. TaxID=1940288 RepID=UPI0026595A75|nr:polysaccharide biosynthesis/export family protein [Ferruginibacter sp.]MDB5276050.1 Polysaccharide biosynthesis/export protein [Ferruginibacter sp.]
MSSFFKSSLFFVTLFLGVLNIISCTSTKQVVYLNDLEKTDSGKLHAAQNAFENPIQKNDQLWITVGGSNPADLPALNSAIGMVTGATSSTITGVAIGYLVEADGKIQMPYIGKVQAEGITRLQLEDTLTQMFKDYTKNPVVNVRFLNYNFSVMGEVNKKGTFNMVNERTTILDAISMAGDLTDFGKRDNVLVVREVNGVRSYARVNLLSKDLFKSPYYYLKTNDVLYVEPVKSKFIARKGVPQYLAIAAVGLSLLITVINLRK